MPPSGRRTMYRNVAATERHGSEGVQDSNVRSRQVNFAAPDIWSLRMSVGEPAVCGHVSVGGRSTEQTPRD